MTFSPTLRVAADLDLAEVREHAGRRVASTMRRCRGPASSSVSVTSAYG